MGLRPIAVTLEPEQADTQFEGVLALLEPIDDRALATIEGAEGELRAEIRAEYFGSEGEPVTFSVDTSGIYVFDPEIEALIARAA